MKQVKINDIIISNDRPFTLIAGPCQMESRDHALYTAEYLRNLTDKLGIQFIYKTSFDKANRTSVNSARGIGLDKAMPIFDEIKKDLGCNTLTDVHSEAHCKIAGAHVDVLQIPAFLCRQTDLLQAAAETGKVVNVKKGQFVAPWDMKQIVNKIEYFGNNNIMLTDRGTCFGYNTLISDMRALPIMAETGYPVVFDATHSVQQPSGQNGVSGGQRQYVETLAKAAVSVGVAAVFMETHPDPDNAPSDGPCMVIMSHMQKLLEKLKAYDDLTKSSLV